jgi:hypothetical protein
MSANVIVESVSLMENHYSREGSGSIRGSEIAGYRVAGKVEGEVAAHVTRP